MDSSEARLDRIEAQRSTSVSHDQLRRRSFPIYMVRYLLSHASSMFRPQAPLGSRGEGTSPPTGLISVVRNLLLTASSFLRPQVFFRNREEGAPPPTGVIYMVRHRLLDALSIFSCSFVQCRGEGTPLRTGDTETVQEFFSNLRLSDFFDFPAGEYVTMTPEIFSRVSDGNKECLEKLRNNGTPLACLKSVQGDSILHLAAKWNHVELVKSIVSECPCLLLEPNTKDQLPIHVAACGGHLAVIEALVVTLTFGAKLSEEELEERERLNLYVVKDINGDTPLHLALKRRSMKIASRLVNANQQASFLADKEGISPLYMAVEIGNVSLVKEMLETRGDDGLKGNKSTLHSKLEGKKYLAHAALKSRSTDILDVILNEDPSLQDERDEEGRTCLSFAAFIGFYDGVCNLLARSTENVYVRNDDGSFPIHIAVERCHSGVLNKIRECYPDSKHLVNKHGHNILHIAAKSGQHHLLRYLMLDKDTRHLGFEQDMDGNTPLHLATINWHSSCVFTFIWNRNILMQLRNNEGLRARDIAESAVQSNYIYQERLTLALLLYATHTLEEPTKSLTIPSDGDHNKDYVNTLLLVAALVAAMTFAAGFTMPGGFNSSGPHLGRAALATDPTLFIFLLLDILALQSSVATIATLIWAQMPLMLFALLCMPLAFLFGMVTAIAHVRWFLTVICVISSIFFYWALFILGPHVLLQLSNVSPDSLGEYLVMLIKYKELLRYLRGIFPYHAK